MQNTYSWHIKGRAKCTCWAHYKHQLQYLWDTSVDESSGRKIELLARSPFGQTASFLIRSTSVQILCVGGWDLDTIAKNETPVKYCIM
jgi:hypothetical protein